MALRNILLVIGVAMSAVMLASAQKGSATPVAPTDIFHGTVELIQEAYAAAYGFLEGHVVASGVPAKVTGHLYSVLTDDPLHHTCQKVGCKKKDITDALDKAQGTVMQLKAQAYEHGSKAHDTLNGLTEQAAAKIETHVPSYKGRVPKKFFDFALLKLYLLFVLWIVFFVVRKVFSMSLSIFCCFCCCGCCRSKKKAAAGGKKKNGAADSAAKKTATQKAAPAKAQPKKK